MKTIETDIRLRDTWDKEAAKFRMAHPFNSFGWGKVREIDGWTPSYFMAREDDRVRGMAMVLSKAIPRIGSTIMYAPRGPVFDPFDREALTSLLGKIKEFGRERGAVFLRIEPNLPEDVFSGTADPFVDQGFKRLEQRWSFWNSPRDVYRIDLSKAADEEELFHTLEKDARRCVRKAHREGVEVRPAESVEELRSFYEMFRKFSVGKGFMVRKLEYQEALWKEFVQRGNGRLFLTMYQGEMIGGLICLLFGKKCVAMHMGAPHEYRKLQPYYAFVWESIRWAREEGCIWYSFRGVGTTSSQESFKRKFGPCVVPLTGYYDLPLSPVLHRVFSAAEFEILPRVWPMLMKSRKVLRRLAKDPP